MLRRPMAGRSETIALIWLTLAVILREGGGTVFDTPAEELEDEDYYAYGQEVAIATAGLGVGLSLVFGLFAFIAMLAMCCRCRRISRADFAIAQAEGDNDGKGLDDMYEIEDYEDQISKHRKILWVFSLIIFLGYLSCAVSAYKGAETSDSSFDSIFDGTDTLLTDVQEALCAKNGAMDCASGSVGDFMNFIARALVSQLQNVVEFISSLSAVVVPLYWVSGNLTAAGGVINRTETSVLHINDSITNVNLILTGDGNVANITGGEGLATISNDVISDISNGKDALESAGSLTSESTADIEAQLSGADSEIASLRYQLDDIPGNEINGDKDLRNSTLSIVNDTVLKPIRDLTEKIFKVQTIAVADARSSVDEYFDMSVQAVAGVIFLPGIVFLLTAICSGLCQSSKPLYLNMFFVFMVQIIFCSVAGIFLAIAKLNGDLCDHHQDLISVNIGVQEATVRDVELNISYDKIYKILKCHGEPGDVPSDTNNFVDIFGARQIFNISSTLDATSKVITDNSGLLTSPKSTITNAQNELSPLSDFVNLDIGGDVNVSESAEEITDILGEMPPSPFDWDSRADQDKVDSFYLSETEFSWNNESSAEVYRLILDDINVVLGAMVPSVLGGPGFEDMETSYNFTQARNLTGPMVCQTDTNFYPKPGEDLKSNNIDIVIYTYGGQWSDLCSNMSVYANITESLEELIVENKETRIELEEVTYLLGLIEGNLSDIQDYQSEMAVLRDNMNGALFFLSGNLDSLVVELNGLANSLSGLNNVVMGASNFTMCGYIGNFYQDVYVDAMCSGLQKNIEKVAVSALVVVVLMFVSFCVQGCYGPSMRKRLRGSAGDVGGQKSRLNATEELEKNVPTPHSASALGGNSGF